MKVFWGIVAIGSAAMLISGCTGGARKVSSCNECVQNANRSATEYCVSWDNNVNDLYCANPCAGDLNCQLGYDCVPLLDQGTPNATSGVLRKVCMPEDYYAPHTGMVRIMAGNCATDRRYACYSDETCLYDSNAHAYLCAPLCASNRDCRANFSCMPRQDVHGTLNWVCMPDYYYPVNQKIVRRMGGDCENNANYLCSQGETCLYDDSNKNDPAYFCAPPCADDNDCASHCCQKAEGGNFYCTPVTYCNH